jgi:nucleoside-diphosphate-sugar epimerase
MAQVKTGKSALIVGVTGIAGVALARQLLKEGWKVFGLSRRSRPGIVPPDVVPLNADLQDKDAMIPALKNVRPEYVFITAWIKRDTEAENIESNGAIMRNLFEALEKNADGIHKVRHVALMTGLKHYLGPFEAYGKGKTAETPFREEEPRLPYPNFYYTQEDELFSASKRMGFTWSVHRAHSIFGFALGNAMNMALTLSVYAEICRELKLPFVFPGSVTQFNALTDVTDSEIVGEQMIWAATHEKGRNEAFNITNGDVFRWRWLWPQIAKYFGLEAQGPTKPPSTLEKKMKEVNAKELWNKIATREKLAEKDVDTLASWWHSDADLGREIECLADMNKSKIAGFLNFRSTSNSFFEKVEEYRAANILPKH